MTPAEALDVLRILDEANVPGRTVAERVRVLIADNDRLAARLEVRARSSDKARLVESLDENRSELLMLLADACLDLGTPEGDAEAKGWGWLAKTNRWPVRNRFGWCWYEEESERSYHIPRGIPGSHNGRCGFPTQSAALLAIVRAIASGRWVPNGRGGRTATPANTRTRSQVRSQQLSPTGMGCCSRNALGHVCDCLDAALPDEEDLL